MKKLRETLDGLRIREIPEERLMYQVMDLQLIKYKGIQSGDIFPDDEVSKAIDKTIQGFIWLYEKGYSLDKNIQTLLQNEDEENYYAEIMKSFGVFNDFMRTHMFLKE